MYKIYFKQAVKMLMQNKFVSIIAIMGTAVAITMIMAIIVSEEIKTVNIAPEVNRSRTLYMSYQVWHDSVAGRTRSGGLSYQTAHEYISKLKKPEHVSVYTEYRADHTTTINPEGSLNTTTVLFRATDAAYWKILQFDFVAGRPYNEEEFTSGVEYVVISESAARKVFNGDDPLGKSLEVNFRPHRVIGVVKDVSLLYRQAYAEIWVPYTSNERYKGYGYNAMLMGRSEEDFPELIAEVRECERQYAIQNTPATIYFKGPENRRIYNMAVRANSISELEHEIKLNDRKNAFVLIVLLLIPAINLSGLSLSRIKKRTAEIGVRKAFGARKYVILVQVLYENFITSIIGGIIGLILSYIAIFTMRTWLLSIPADSPIPVSSLISPYILLAVFVACIFINLLSAGIPALRASKVSVINSLNQNDKQS